MPNGKQYSAMTYHLIAKLEIFSVANETQHFGNDLSCPLLRFGLGDMIHTLAFDLFTSDIQPFALLSAVQSEEKHLKKQTRRLSTPYIRRIWLG